MVPPLPDADRHAARGAGRPRRAARRGRGRPAARRAGEGVGQPRRRVPSPVADDLDELIRTLLSWEDAYREDRGLGPRPRRGRYAPTLSKCLAWLGAHLDGLLRFPGAEDFGAEVLDLHRRLKGRTTGGGPRRATPLPCPRCDLLTLAHDVVAERVRCRQCRWSATVEEYEAYSRRRAS
ncbi:hypothetical protein ACFQHO_06650 [Actinomadura yumaensis]|uniref:hypothetical protein n=1 Tax=Actinomadura yumaensis TaxID=111807 RepID=UPI003607D519